MKKVFIIEDYESTAIPLKFCFERLGYEAEYCMDSQSAVRAALKFKPDGVVADIRMPIRLGTEVLNELDNKMGKEFSMVLYSNYFDDPTTITQLEELNIPEDIKIRKTGDITRDVEDKIIPALEKKLFVKGKKKE